MTWTTNFKQGVDVPPWHWLQQCPVTIQPGSSFCYDGNRYLYFAVQSGSATAGTASTSQLYAFDTWSNGWGLLATLTSGNQGMNCVYDANRNMVYITTGAALTSWQAYNPNATAVTVCATSCAARTVTTMAPILPAAASTGSGFALPSWGNMTSGGTLNGVWNDPQPAIAAAAGGSTTNVKTATNQFTPTMLGMQVSFTSGVNAGKKAVITAVGSGTSVTVAPALTGTPGAGDTFQIQLPVGTASSATASTLVDSTQTWTTNQYGNSDVVITSGTGSGQRRRIASNTATTLTLAGAVTGNSNTGNWSVTPDATSVYQIQPSGDFLYFASANGTATVWKLDLSQTTGAAWAGLTVAPAALSGGSNLLHLKGAGAFYLTTLRGSATATMYNYAIGPNTWSTPTTLFGVETFTTGSSYDYLEGHRKLFITKEAQSRCYTLDLTSGILYTGPSVPYAVPIASDGQDVIHVTTANGVEWLYSIKRGGSTFYRVPIEWGD